MIETEKLCRCGFSNYDEQGICHSGGIGSHPFVELVCHTCSKPLPDSDDLDYSLSTAGLVYCVEHCPSHVWDGNHDGRRWCSRCGIDRGDYWEWKATGVMLS